MDLGLDHSLDIGKDLAYNKERKEQEKKQLEKYKQEKSKQKYTLSKFEKDLNKALPYIALGIILVVTYFVLIQGLNLGFAENEVTEKFYARLEMNAMQKVNADYFQASQQTKIHLFNNELSLMKEQSQDELEKLIETQKYVYQDHQGNPFLFGDLSYHNYLLLKNRFDGNDFEYNLLGSNALFFGISKYFIKMINVYDPLYPLIKSINLFMIILGLLCVGLLFFIGWELSGKIWLGFFSSFLLAIHPLFFRNAHAGVFLRYTFDLVIILLFIYAYLIFEKKYTRRIEKIKTKKKSGRSEIPFLDIEHIFRYLSIVIGLVFVLLIYMKLKVQLVPGPNGMLFAQEILPATVFDMIGMMGGIFLVIFFSLGLLVLIKNKIYLPVIFSSLILFGFIQRNYLIYMLPFFCLSVGMLFTWIKPRAIKIFDSLGTGVHQKIISGIVILMIFGLLAGCVYDDMKENINERPFVHKDIMEAASFMDEYKGKVDVWWEYGDIFALSNDVLNRRGDYGDLRSFPEMLLGDRKIDKYIIVMGSDLERLNLYAELFEWNDAYNIRQEKNYFVSGIERCESVDDCIIENANIHIYGDNLTIKGKNNDLTRIIFNIEDDVYGFTIDSKFKDSNLVKFLAGKKDNFKLLKTINRGEIIRIWENG